MSIEDVDRPGDTVSASIRAKMEGYKGEGELALTDRRLAFDDRAHDHHASVPLTEITSVKLKEKFASSDIAINGNKPLAFHIPNSSDPRHFACEVQRAVSFPGETVRASTRATMEGDKGEGEVALTDRRLAFDDMPRDHHASVPLTEITSVELNEKLTGSELTVHGEQPLTFRGVHRSEFRRIASELQRAVDHPGETVRTSIRAKMEDYKGEGDLALTDRRLIFDDVVHDHHASVPFTEITSVKLNEKLTSSELTVNGEQPLVFRGVASPDLKRITGELQRAVDHPGETVRTSIRAKMEGYKGEGDLALTDRRLIFDDVVHDHHADVPLADVKSLELKKKSELTVDGEQQLVFHIPIDLDAERFAFRIQRVVNGQPYPVRSATTPGESGKEMGHRVRLPFSRSIVMPSVCAACGAPTSGSSRKISTEYESFLHATGLGGKKTTYSLTVPICEDCEAALPHPFRRRHGEKAPRAERSARWTKVSMISFEDLSEKEDRIHVRVVSRDFAELLAKLNDGDTGVLVRPGKLRLDLDATSAHPV